MIIIIICVIGILLSAYHYGVRQKKLTNASYKAFCDINQTVSCTTVFSLKQSKLLGIPNPLLGMLLYISIILSELLLHRTLTIILSSLGVLASTYLASVLIKHRLVCIVCIANYVLVTALLVLTLANT